MPRPHLRLPTWAVLLLALAFSPQGPVFMATAKPITMPPKPVPAPTQLLVQLRQPAGGVWIGKQRLPPGAKLGPTVTRDNVHLVSITDGSSVQKKLAEVRAWPGVVYAEPDYLVEMASTQPNDKLYVGDYQPYLDTMGATWAWDITTGSRNVTVCTIDSGIQLNHPDLQDNIPQDSPGIDTRNINSSMWLDMRPNAAWWQNVSMDVSDTFGHGTWVSGVVGAVGNNSRGVTGVAWKVNIISCRIFGASERATISSTLPCFDYCRVRKAKIFVASWGTSSQSKILRATIKRSLAEGALLVAAAGNKYSNMDTAPFYPAFWSRNIPGLISVGATDSAGNKPDFSNWGTESVDLMAQGVSVYTTDLGSSYYGLDGTSFAGPLVAGAAALMSAANGTLSGAELKWILRLSVDKLPQLAGLCRTGGRLNIGRAVYRAVGQCYPPDGLC